EAAPGPAPQEQQCAQQRCARAGGRWHPYPHEKSLARGITRLGAKESDRRLVAHRLTLLGSKGRVRNLSRACGPLLSRRAQYISEIGLSCSRPLTHWLRICYIGHVTIDKKNFIRCPSAISK